MAKSKVVYPKPETRIHGSKNPLTEKDAKELLGWKEVEDNKPCTLKKDHYGKRINCTNNTSNRRFVLRDCNQWKQEMVRRRWQLNGVNIIVGKSGQILSGQHRLIAFVLLVQEWQDGMHQEFWKEEPTLQTYIACGISEEDKVINTIDIGVSRTLAHVIFRSDFFSDLSVNARDKCSKICQYAIQQVWHRTGVGNAFAPNLRGTHSEFLDFLDRHPKLLDCVKFIHEKNGKEKKISRWLSPGYAAGLLYLMGSGKSDGETYRKEDVQSEDLLNWKLWNRACDFFSLLAGNSPDLSDITKSLGQIEEDKGKASRNERMAIIAKAWCLFSAGKPVLEKSLRLQYHTDELGITRLTECPPVGGIDIGNPAEFVDETPTPSQSEIKSKSQAVRSTSSEKKPAKKKKRQHDQKSTVIGTLQWVKPPEGDPWRGKVIDTDRDLAKLTVCDGHQGAGNERWTPINALSPRQPSTRNRG